MKLSVFLLVCSIGLVQAADSYAQKATVSLEMRNQTVKEVLDEIEEQSDFSFFFNIKHVDLQRKVSVVADKSDIFKVLETIFAGTDVRYSVVDRKIILSMEKLQVQQSKEEKTVTGVVKDQNGDPIIGANVIEKGTTNGVITDIDGKFSLIVSDKAVIQVSYIGYSGQNVPVGNRTDLTILLREDSQALDEVVVVGYGVQKKVNLTGSVSTLDFEKQSLSRPVTNVSNALAGVSAGVQVNQASGEPGSDGSSIRIRGIGTLNNSAPLVLIDGIEGSMDLVNPQDIENISILKDAASSSIYGSRAANGVILITTKKGKAGKLSISYSGRVSYAQPTNLIDQVTDYADYMTLMNESYENIGQPKNFAQSTIDLWREKSKDPNGLNEYGVPNYIAYPNTDWQDYLFGHGLVNDHNISLSGGTDKIRTLLSVGFLDNPGIVENTGITKYNMRANIEADVTKWLTVGNRIFASLEDKEPGSFDNANTYLRQTTPGLYPEYNGAYGFPEAPEEHATANSLGRFLNATKGNKQKSNINTTFYSKVTFIKGLSWDFNFNYKRYWEENQSWPNPVEQIKFSDGTVMVPVTAPSEMSTSFSNVSDYSYTLQNIIRYNTTINGVHDIGAIAGYEEFYYKKNSTNAEKKGLIDASIHVPNTATEMISIGGNTIDQARRSFFGRINYAYKSKYLLEANLRYDGNSRYHKKYRYGVFPSFSAAWRISEESFMENSKDWLENLKLRLSYGSVGNDGGKDVGNYEYMAVYKEANYPLGGLLSSGVASVSIANSMLSWETTTMANIGVDLNMLSNRLAMTVDVFSGKTTGILFTPSIPITVGDKTPPRQNIAEMVKKGFELSVGWQDNVGEVSYSVNGNFAYTPDKVTKYKGTLQEGYDQDGNWHSNLGDVSSSASAVNPIIEDRLSKEYYLKTPYQGSGKGFDADGIHGGPVDGMIRTEADMEWVRTMIDKGYSFMPNQTVAKDKIWYGDYIYGDINEDGIYGGTDDRQFQGFSSNPKFNFGLQLSAAWKGFDLSMNWAGAAGFKLYWAPATGYNTPSTRLGCAIGSDLAYNHYFYDPQNPSDPRTNLQAKYGRFVSGEKGFQNYEASTLYLFNGNYLKLKNITFGYTFPKSLIDKLYMANLRVYTSIENVFNITKFPGQDPEMGANPKYTSLRQFAFGVNVSF